MHKGFGGCSSTEQIRIARCATTSWIRSAIAAALLIGLGGCSGNDSATFEEPAAEFRPTTILEAVLVSDADAVRDFLAQGADVNATEIDGTTLLMRAIHGRNPQIAQLLIDAGANVSATNRYGVNPLYLAARSTDAQTARALLAAGADANTSLPEGETALMTAAKTGSTEIVQALLAGSSGTPLFGNASGGGAAADVTTSGYSAAAGSALVNRADPNAKEGWYGQTALMWAAAEGHADVVRLLIEAGAELDEHSALINAPEPNAERLQGGFVYPRIPQGRFTALHFAAREGQIESVQALIDGGADLNAVDQEGTNALILAILNGHFGVAALLLEAGADPKIAASYFETPP